MYLTEKELLARQKEQLFGIQKMLKNTEIDLDDLSAFLPGLVHLNKVQTLDLVYLDKQSRQRIEVNREELLVRGGQLLKEIVKPESFEQAKNLFGKVDFKESSLVVSHFQALKGFSGKKGYEWYFSVKKRFNDQLILTISNPVSTLGPMQEQVKRILEENIFLRKNLPKLNSLTRREKEIIRLILKGNSSMEMAEKLFISPHTVRTHRKNIWKKLEISTHAELFKFARELDLLS